jgi:hypothetical protein
MGFDENTGREGGGFGVPGDYFARSQASLLNRMACAEELREFPSLSSLKNTQPFMVPPGYFEKSAAGLEVMAYPLLAAARGDNPFTVPNGYFNKSLLQEQTGRREARVIRISFRAVITSMAAVLVIAAGIWLYRNHTAAEADCGGLACVDRQEIKESKPFQSLDDEDLYDVVDADRLERELTGGKRPADDTSAPAIELEDLE